MLITESSGWGFESFKIEKPFFVVKLNEKYNTVLWNVKKLKHCSRKVHVS